MDESNKRTKSSVQVMVNGLPGNMGKEIAVACQESGIEIVEYALTGPNMPAEIIVGPSTIKLIQSNKEAEDIVSKLQQTAKEQNKILIAIDFTLPAAVNGNATFYTKLNLPFVMGTTGGDRQLLQKTVAGSGSYALIAPNMCKQIVALQAMLEYMSEQFPAAFRNYTLEIVESHQSTKVDTSGTAKAMLQYFNKLKGGKPMEVSEIKKLRKKEDQLNFGVAPNDIVKGHAWHTYTLKSNDGSVMFQFKHNVNGRRTYADGVVDAVNYLAGKIMDQAEQKVYNMIDVLREGGMRE